MATNPKGYMKRYRMEIKTELLFLCSNGTMKSSESGVPLRITPNRRKEPDEAGFHHMLQLNGADRGNGSTARLRNMLKEYWNILPLTFAEHQEKHGLNHKW